MYIGIFGTSLKKNEKRIPIHPEHFDDIDDHILKKLIFEEGYAQEFGFDIAQHKHRIAGILPRSEIFEQCNILILPKFSSQDNNNFREGQTIYGWPHCVQGSEITQVAIDKKLTLIAFEAMFSGKHHIFHKNNEIAGFASLNHCLQLNGVTGLYSKPMKAVVLGFGSTGRGAVTALQSQGINTIEVYTQRAPHLIQNQIPGVIYSQYRVKNNRAYHNSKELLLEKLKDVDIIVNCILQNPNNPVDFVRNTEVLALKKNAMLIDVSCDTAMGFEFAIPTSFDEPGFKVQEHIYYYAVDHTPTLFWNSSSYELSKALLPFIANICEDAASYNNDEILSKAVEIEHGKVKNLAILEYQSRQSNYPHRKNNEC